MDMLFTVVLVLLLLASGLRVFRPFGLKLEGETTYAANMPLLARLRMHAIPVVIGELVVIAFILGRDAPIWTLVIPVIAYAMLVAIPVKYILTTRGIRVGLTDFRRWTEFAGVSRSRGGVVMQGVPGSRRMMIWLAGGREDDEFIHLLRQSIRSAYKGDSALGTDAYAEDSARDHATIVTI